MDGRLVGWFGWVGRTSFSASGNGLEMGMAFCPPSSSHNADPGNEMRMLAFLGPVFSATAHARVSQFSGRDREK